MTLKNFFHAVRRAQIQAVSRLALRLRGPFYRMSAFSSTVSGIWACIKRSERPTSAWSSASCVAPSSPAPPGAPIRSPSPLQAFSSHWGVRFLSQDPLKRYPLQSNGQNLFTPVPAHGRRRTTSDSSGHRIALTPTHSPAIPPGHRADRNLPTAPAIPYQGIALTREGSNDWENPSALRRSLLLAVPAGSSTAWPPRAAKKKPPLSWRVFHS